MASEDNFLRLDPLYEYTELKSLLETSSLSFDDCETLYQNGKMNKEDYEYARNWFGFYKK